MSRLILIRHGPTQWNRERRLQGRTDIPLSAAGRDSIAAWRMVPEVSQGIWYTSPLSRAVETAALLGKSNAEIEPCLIEMSWGDWEGRTLDELKDICGYTELSQRDGLDFRPPGGESRHELIARQRPFWRRIGKLNDTIVAITHKGIIEATMAAATGWDMRTKRPAKVGLGASHLFEIDREGTPSVIQLNVTGEIKH